MNVFEDIYLRNLWNGQESRSGPGSGTIATMNIGPTITRIVCHLNAKSVLDVACGDGFWMPDLPGYVGMDVSRTAIMRARRFHGDRMYRIGDIRTRLTEPFDVVILRDCIQHLSLEDGVGVMDAIKAGRHRWLLASTYDDGYNADIETGDAYRPDMTREPFNLPEPDEMFFDGYTYHDPDAVRDAGKHLGLWRL